MNVDLVKSRFSFAACVFVTVVGVPEVAQAQSRDGAIGSESQPVASRSRPGYDAVGVPLGAFRLFPSISSSIGYDDNLYASSVLKAKDGFVSIAPRVVLRSQWVRHQLNLSVNGSARRYFSRTIENSEQYGATLDGQVDVDRRTTFKGSASLARRVEPRGEEGDTFIGGEPITYRQLALSVDGTRQMGRFTLDVGADYGAYNYPSARVGGVDVDLSYRNSKSLSGKAQLNYRISPGISAFASLTANQLRYPNEPLTADRDSDGYSILGGVSFGISSVLTGDIGLGYIRQNFDNPIFKRVSGLDYKASLVWNPTELTTITGKVGRSIQRSPIIGSAGIVLTQSSLQADHELLRNVILGGGVNYTVGSYGGASQSEHRIGTSLSVRYLMNRHMSWSLTESFTKQTSGLRDVSTPVLNESQSYTRNSILLGLNVQL